MGKATNTKDFVMVDAANKFPKTQNIIKSYIKPDKTLRWVGADGIEFPLWWGGGDVVSYGELSLAEGWDTWNGQTDLLHLNWIRAKHMVDSNTWQIEPEYVNGFMKITERSPTPTIWKDMQFADIASLYTWLATVASQTTWIYDYDITVEIYDIIDTDIPSIAKIYWQNMFFSMLKRANMYKKTIKTLDDNHERGDYETWLQEVIREVTPYTTYVRSWGDGGNQAVRIPSSHRKMYGLLRGDATIYMRSWWPRYTTDGANIIDNVTSPNSTFYSVDHNNSKYCSLNMSWSSRSFYKKDYVVEFQRKAKSYSSVVCYRTKSWDNYAVFIKPVWIDTITIPYFDTSKYDLYGYMHWRNKYNQLKLITITTQSDAYSSCFRITKDNRSPLKDCVWSTNWYWEPFNMRLILRDKVSWKISPLSKPKIVWRSWRDKPMAADIRY